MQHLGIIGLTVLVALTLSAVSLHQHLQWLRPEWLCMVIIYWTITWPHRIGLASAFFCGILLDALEGVVLGQHAIALAIVLVLSYLLHLRIRVFPIWQQSVIIFTLVSVFSMICQLIQGGMNLIPRAFWCWTPAMTSALLWPCLYFGLGWIRRRWSLD